MVTEKMGLSMMYLAFRGMIPIVAFRSESQSAFEMNEELKRWTSKIPPIAIKYILRIKTIIRQSFHVLDSIPEHPKFASFYLSTGHPGPDESTFASPIRFFRSMLIQDQKDAMYASKRMQTLLEYSSLTTPPHMSKRIISST